MESQFAQWLRAELDQRGWGIRTLARQIDPGNPEVPRRAINRYMRGTQPSEPYVQAIAAALGVPRGSVPVEVAPQGTPFDEAVAELVDQVRLIGETLARLQKEREVAA